MRPFDLLLALLLGSMGFAFIAGRIPLPQTMTAIGFLLWIHLAMTLLTQRIPLLLNLLWGVHLQLVHHGIVTRKALEQAGITESQLDDLLHRRRIDCVTDLDLLVIEPDGTILMTAVDPVPRLQQAALPGLLQPPAKENPWLRTE